MVPPRMATNKNTRTTDQQLAEVAIVFGQDLCELTGNTDAAWADDDDGTTLANQFARNYVTESH